MIALLAFALLGVPSASADDEATEILRLERSVSSSRGRTGGVVVFWPRIIPATLDNEVNAQGGLLQQKMIEIAERAAPLSRRDVRPEPERVCPRDRGCRAVSLGLLIGQRDGGCVAVGVLGPPAQSQLELFPLVGEVELASQRIPFRSPPEDAVTVREFVPCSQLTSDMDDSALVLRLRQLLRQ